MICAASDRGRVAVRAMHYVWQDLVWMLGQPRWTWGDVVVDVLFDDAKRKALADLSEEMDDER